MLSVYKLLILPLLLVLFGYSIVEFEPVTYREPLPRRRIYPEMKQPKDADIFQNFSYRAISNAVRQTKVFDLTIINKKTMPQYRKPLLHTKMKVYEFEMNYDATKFAITFDEYGYSKLFYLEPAKIILQEFSIAFGFMDETPKMSKDGSSIYFVSRRFDNKEIFQASYDDYFKTTTYRVKQIVDNLYDNENLTVSDDGKKIAYQSRKEEGRILIFVKDINTGKELVPTYVTEDSINPLLSGDGKTLLYEVVKRKAKNLYFVNLETKIVTLVSDFVDKTSKSAISADGNRIVFTGKYDYNVTDLFMLDRKANLLYNLTANAKENCYNPSISADGQVIAYQANEKWMSRSIKVIDFRSNKIYYLWDRHLNQVTPIVSRDGNTLVYKINGVLMKTDLKKLREKSGSASTSPSAN